MNPETAVAIFNAIVIGGGALVAFGTIAHLERSKRKRQKQTQEDLPTFELLQEQPVDGKYVESIREKVLPPEKTFPGIKWGQIKFPKKK